MRSKAEAENNKTAADILNDLANRGEIIVDENGRVSMHPRDRNSEEMQ